MTRAAVRFFAAALASAALAACAAIPTSGPVVQGDAEVAQPGEFLPILEGPQPGASAQAIVQGFLTAAAGGSVSGFDVAREFLTPEASAAWDPLEHVTVFDSREVVPRFDEATGTFVYSVPVAAVVDSSGVMVEAGPEVRSELEFIVAREDGGEYRIVALDNGILVSAADFDRFYRAVNLYFASPDLTTLVPELRWFASNDQVATAVTKELVEGPSPWLADAVRTGFPAGSTLAVDAVVVEDGVATVALAPGSVGDAAQRSLAGEQLDATLAQLPQVQEVETTVADAVPLGGDGSVTLAAAPMPPESAAVFSGGRAGLFDGATLRVTADKAGGVPDTAHGLALAYDGVTAAFLVGGSVVVTSVLGEDALVDASIVGAEAPVGVVETRALIEGEDMVAPSFDRFGWLWSTESSSQGVVRVSAPDGKVTDLALPALAGTSVQAIAVSRDGSRLAILSRSAGQQVLEVVGVSRDQAGAPTALGVPLAVGAAVRHAIDLAWIDENSVVSLGEESGEMALIQVGGWTTDASSVAGAVAVTARNGVRSLLAVEPDGTLVVRQGNGWAPASSSVTDVAFAG